MRLKNNIFLLSGQHPLDHSHHLCRLLILQHVLALRHFFIILACTFCLLIACTNNAFAITDKDIAWKEGLSTYQHFIVFPHLEKGFKELNKGDLDIAIKEFEQAHKLALNQPNIALYLATAYEKKKNYERAIALLETQLKKNPAREDLKKALLEVKVKLVTSKLDQAESLSKQPQALQKLLSIEKIEFNQPYDESRWIKLLADTYDASLLLTYRPKYKENELLLIELSLNQLLVNANEQATKNYLDTVSQQIRAHPKFLDATTYQLIEHGASNLALPLLLAAYPFAQTDAVIRKKLMARIAFAQSVATDKNTLIQFVLKRRPTFSTAQQEQEWLSLLAITAQNQSSTLLNYQTQFATNKILQAQRILDAFENSEGKISAKQLKPFLSDLKTLTPEQLEQVTFKFDREGDVRESLNLLLAQYPFKGVAIQLSNSLLDRLITISMQRPQLLSASELARLSVPLALAQQRSKQSQLFDALRNCQVVIRLLEDYSTAYTSVDWSRLGNCYQKEQKSGLAQFAYQQAYDKTPTQQNARALAYQTFETKDYFTSLKMWKIVLANNQISVADRMAAINTAVSDQQLTLAKQWINDYERSGGQQTDHFWWLKTSTVIQENPREAIEYLKRAISLQPKVEYFETLAGLEIKMGNIAGASLALEKALALDPSNSAIQAALGFAYYDQHKLVQSEQLLEQASKLRPDDNKITEQLAYVNQRLGQNKKAIFFTERSIDNNDFFAAEQRTPEFVNKQFSLRRMHEDLTRKWTFSVDAISGNQVSAISNSPQPGLNYKSYGQAEIAYRLGDPSIDDGKTLSVFSRIFAGNGVMNSAFPLYAPVLAAGLRWKPFSNQVIILSVEEQIPLDQGQSPSTNTLIRASASFFNSGKYSDEWHPTAQGWLAQNLYLDAAYYLTNKLSSLTADYRLSYHNKLGENQTIEPYSHIQWNAVNQQSQADTRIGVGVRWNIWGNESHYNAYASKISVGIEFQYALSTYLSDKTTALITLGGRW